MKVKLKIEKEFDVKYLLAEVGARYWDNKCRYIQIRVVS